MMEMMKMMKMMMWKLAEDLPPSLPPAQVLHFVYEADLHHLCQPEHQGREWELKTREGKEEGLVNEF